MSSAKSRACVRLCCIVTIQAAAHSVHRFVIIMSITEEFRAMRGSSVLTECFAVVCVVCRVPLLLFIFAPAGRYSQAIVQAAISLWLQRILVCTVHFCFCHNVDICCVFVCDTDQKRDSNSSQKWPRETNNMLLAIAKCAERKSLMKT